jgi:hypothetical protein
MKRFCGHIAAILCVVLLAGCRPATFLIDRQGSSSYFGRNSPYLQRLLCTKGDLMLILADADLPAGLASNFYRYTCSEEKSYEKVISLYLFLTPEEKKRLKKAFEKHGYAVNHLHC